MNTRAAAISIVCLLFVSPPAHCQWIRSVLPQGNRDIISCATIGNTVFAGTNMGVFRSTDEGTTWSWTDSAHLPFANVKALMVKGGSIYAGVSSARNSRSGVYISADAGGLWTAANNSILKNTDVWALAAIGENLFAGTSDSGAFLSANNGASWTAIDNGLTNKGVLTLTASGSTLYAGTGNGVFLSTNNGAIWTPANNGILNEGIYGIAVVGSYLIAGTVSDGIFRSANNGAFWTAANTGLPYPQVNWVHALAVSGNTVFAATQGGGVFRSTNNGATWTAINNGLTDLWIYSLAVSDNYLYAGSGNYAVWRIPLSEITASIPPNQQAAFLHTKLRINSIGSRHAGILLNYSIQSRCLVHLGIYTVSGKRIAEFEQGEKAPGEYSEMPAKSTIPDGLYIYRFQAGSYQESNFLRIMK